MSSVFPLVPNHALRCFWVLCQLILAFPLIFFSSQQLAGENNIAAIVNFLFAFLLLVWACCDILLCFLIVFQKYFSQQQTTNHTRLNHCFTTIGKLFVCQTIRTGCTNNYSDVLRLVVTEIVTYLILVSATIDGPLTNVAMLACSAITFVILVYFTQLLFFNVKLNFTHFKPTTQSKAYKCLLFCFHVHLVGYQILQTLLMLFLIHMYTLNILTTSC